MSYFMFNTVLQRLVLASSTPVKLGSACILPVTSRTTRIQIAQQLAPRPIRTMASNVPKTMKAVCINKHGDRDVLECRDDIPVPELKEGEILVKNEYSGVNFIDTYQRSGLYPAPHFPYVLGREGAGTVAAVGPGTHSSSIQQAASDKSQLVVYLAQGSYAEYCAVSSEKAYVVPAGVSSETSAATLLQGLTAITLMREAHYVKKGDWVLVPAAAGGMGLWLCQLLNAFGAHVIGTASTSEKRELARKSGAEVTLEYPETMGAEKYVQAVKSYTPNGEGVAVAFDGVGKATFDTSLDCIARKGSMISFGNASGPPDPFKIARLATKNIRLMRPTLFNYIVTREEFESNTKELFDLVSSDNVKVSVHKVYELKDVQQAHEDLESRKTTGKLLLKL